MSRELAAVADRVLGAGGRLIAARDAISAAVTARSQTAGQPRGGAAASAADDDPPVPAPAVSTVESTCPECDQRVAVRVAVSLLPAVVDTGLCAAHERALASVAAAGGVPVWRIPPARPRPPVRLRAVLADAWYRAFPGAPGGPMTAGGPG